VTETELKILLDDRAERALLDQPALGGAGARPALLTSVYFDTAARDLSRHGIALRVRRKGRQLVQTIKKARAGVATGLATPEEEERAVGSLRPELAPGSGPLAEEVARLAGPADLVAVFETRVERRTWPIEPPGGGRVELALDRGEIVAGGRRAPIREAEIELKEGGPGAVFAAARLVFRDGPLHFAALSKAERGFLLADGGEGEPPVAPLRAGRMAFDPGCGAEIAALAAFRDGLAQIAVNMLAVVRLDDPEGVHELRVGLRRLRTAIGLYGDTLGEPALAPVAEAAKRLAALAGPLRDLDVLAQRLARLEAAGLLDERAQGALARALDSRRTDLRGTFRATLSEPEWTGFVLDLSALLATRRWLSVADLAQPARLARPVATLAPQLLDRALRKALAAGRDLRRMTPEERHGLRKRLKTLRYATAFLAPVWKDAPIRRYLRALRRLQERFGAANDAATAMAVLTGDGAPGAGDPDAQRAAGFLLGTLAAGADGTVAALQREWKAFRAARPFWRDDAALTPAARRL
jgi:inorganic triphosphatase YgiF